MSSQTQQLSIDLAKVVGAEQVIAGGDIGERYRLDITKAYSSRPAFLVRPATTEQVAAVVQLAAAHHTPVTVIGGQTGTVGSAVPSDSGIALSLERMNRIIEIDVLSMTMTVEAGCLLQLAQEAAENSGAFLPLDLGAR